MALKETWDSDNTADADDGRFATSRLQGSSATWRFSTTAGQRAVLYGVRQPSGGNADVYVDGVKRATASFYRATTRHQVAVFTSAELSAGQHTLEVRVLGTKPSASKNTWVGVDALRIGSTRHQESAATHRFQRVTTSAALGGSYDVVTHGTSGDNGADPTYSLVFKGTAVLVRATKGPTSGSARMYVDGVLRRTVNLRADATAYQVLVASITGLTEARHTLRIEAVGTSTGAKSAVGIDRINVELARPGPSRWSASATRLGKSLQRTHPRPQRTGSPLCG